MEVQLSACVMVGEVMYVFGGYSDRDEFTDTDTWFTDTMYSLDTPTLTWTIQQQGQKPPRPRFSQKVGGNFLTPPGFSSF